MSDESTEGAVVSTSEVEEVGEDSTGSSYMQNRELSWLNFNERVLDLGADSTIPLFERLNFASIYWSNLQEFFMIRVGSLTDLSLVKKRIVENKTGLTPAEQLRVIYDRCHELYPLQESIFLQIKDLMHEENIHHLELKDLDDEQMSFLKEYLDNNVVPFLAPQIVNILHPFPHLENGALYVIVQLDEIPTKKQQSAAKAAQGSAKESAPQVAEAPEASKPHDTNTLSASDDAGILEEEAVQLGIIPLPHRSKRIIPLPGEGCSFILLEAALELIVPEIFSMYSVQGINVVCITRNADLDPSEGIDETDEDYRAHMKRILKKRRRLLPVRLESRLPLIPALASYLLHKLDLKPHQTFVTAAPLDMSYTSSLASFLEQEVKDLKYLPFKPEWPASLSRNRSMLEQVGEHEVLLSYPYECMDPFIQLLREAATDPSVVSIKITLYRLASQSHLAEALIAAAENGKEVTALFELRARFDESNNIEWSQRFEEAGAHVLYGFNDYKVHSKICCITRQTEKGVQYITQLGTGNYNEKTARLYTDLAFITTDKSFGRDAMAYFRNMGLEHISDEYDLLLVAPLQIKTRICSLIDEEIHKAEQGEPCGVFLKTNSITDKKIIKKLSEASNAGVPIVLFVRGICCLVPGIAGATENIRVVSVVGRLLEHSRIYGFGPLESMRVYLSSADLMTRNMDKRIEIAWPVLSEPLRQRLVAYVKAMLRDTAKLRELLPDKSYTPAGFFAAEGEEGNRALFDAQEYLIDEARVLRLKATEEEALLKANQLKVDADEVTQEEASAVVKDAVVEAGVATEDAATETGVATEDATVEAGVGQRSASAVTVTLNKAPESKRSFFSRLAARFRREKK